ncbi:MAG TPA: relaxase/mobilization nuclease domain-containing protein [Vicinamibacterales bacterium]|nr:relaxase/mobilization nuclease domain-containing protein [Vicinamibacterales bacterium]
MIAKTSSGKSFGGLMHYLEEGRSGRERDRVDWTASRNLFGTDDPALAGQVMEATADQSLRVQKPVYHVSLSFDPTDMVNRERMELVADRLLDRLGLQDHQAMFVAHRDREHAHVHIVVNRVHPETGVAWERWQDHPRIERTLRETERELGLREVPGRLYRAPGHELPERALDTSGERHAAERTHEMSFVDKARQHLPEWRQAQSWEDLSERLAKNGFRIEPKGQGIVITDGEQYVRASRVARDLSVNRLEQKFDAPYPGRALNEPGREIDPAIRGLVRDIRAYDEAARHHNALGEAEARARDAAEHVHTLERASRDWRNRADDVARAFGRVYQAPEDARARLAELERANGKEAVTRELHDRPEQFGRLRTVDRPGVLGLVRRDDAPARAEARQLGVAIDDYRKSEQTLRSHLRPGGELTQDRVVTAERAAGIARDRAEGAVRELHEAGRNLPDRRALQRTIGELASTLSAPESRLLRTFVTDAQSRLVTKFKGIVREIALGRDRGLEL